MVATGEVARFEHYLDQLERWYDVTAFPRGGDRFAVLYDDITGRKRAEAQQAAAATLDQFRVRLTDALRSLDQADQITLVASRTLGEQLRAGRVYYAEVAPDDEDIVIPPGYYTGDSSSIAGRHRLKDFGAYIIQELRANRPVVTADSQTVEQASDGERSAYRATGVRAFIAHPLVRQGRLVAVLGVTQPTPREWTSLEVELARETAARTWEAVERARAETALRTSEARFRLFVTASSDTVYTMSPDWSEMLNLEGKAFIASTHHPSSTWLQEYIPPEDRPHVLAAIQEAIAARRSFELEHQVMRLDGSVGWTFSRAVPLLDAQGEIVEWIGTARDVTERKRAEAALRESEARFRLMADAVPHIVWLTDAEGRAEFFNKQWSTYTGVAYEPTTAAEVAAQFIHPDDAAMTMAAFDQARRTGSVFAVEHRIRSAEGTYRWFLVRAEPYHDPQTGAIVRWFGASTDIHDRKDAEARLLELYDQEQAARKEAEQANRLKDEFLATVSHELRTPLTAFLGYASLVQRRQRDEAYVRRAVEKMVQSAQAQAQIIEDLLDISRIVSGKLRIEPTPLRLADVVHAALDTVRPSLEAKGLHLNLELDQNTSTVLGDPGRLQQVIWNLLSNAVKFTPSGGRIAVRLAGFEDAVELSVRDSGQGIAPAFLPYVFERFRQADSSSQRAHGGLGLGLAIVRHLIELHGGTVGVASAGEGQGATFVVRLPLARTSTSEQAERAPGDKADEAASQPLPLAGRRVLVVDDQPEVLDLLADMLAGEGATVQTCPTARGALDLLRSWRPDVLVSDIAMPGKDGYWLIEQVRRLLPEEGGATPAVALTAYVRMEDRLRVLAAGFQQYVPKPVDVVELSDVVLGLVSQERTE